MSAIFLDNGMTLEEYGRYELFLKNKEIIQREDIRDVHGNVEQLREKYGIYATLYAMLSHNIKLSHHILLVLEVNYLRRHMLPLELQTLMELLL